LPPIFFLKLQQDKAATADLNLRIHSANPMVRYGEYFGLIFAFIFGVGLLILSTQQYVVLVEQLSNHTHSGKNETVQMMMAAAGSSRSSSSSINDSEFGPVV